MPSDNNINVFSLRTGPPQCPLSFQVYIRWKENMIQTFTSACCRLMLRLGPVGKSGCKVERQNASAKKSSSQDRDYVHYKTIGAQRPQTNVYIMISNIVNVTKL